MLGDWNSHSTAWGCQKTNKKGKELEKVIQNNNLCILNNKSHTYLNTFTGSYSAIDLTLCDPIRYMDYRWKVHDGLWGSYHFPILLEILQPFHDERLPHWKLNKTKWKVFETLCEQKLFHGPNTTDQTKYFTETLISIANESKAKNSTSNKHNTGSMMTAANLFAYIRLPYVNSISYPPSLISTTSNSSGQERKNLFRKPRRKVNKTMPTNWSSLPKLTQSGGWFGKSLENPNQPLSNTSQKKQTEATTRKDIAEVLAKTFSEKFFLKTSNPQFISYKSKSEKQRLNFKTNNSEKHNLPFTPAELKALQISHNTEVSPDEIHYEFLKHLTKNSLSYLLKIFNDILINETFPESWKIATIIPIYSWERQLKPSKLPPNNTN